MLDISRQEAVSELRRSLEQLQQSNQELQKALAELDRLASTDKLTGTWNRRRLADAVTNEMERLRRYDHPVSLLIVDIDFFKKVNDDHGHVVGDQVLTKLATLLQSNVRVMDSLTRWGGEEFVVLCPNTTLSTVAMLAERLRKDRQCGFPGGQQDYREYRRGRMHVGGNLGAVVSAGRRGPVPGQGVRPQPGSGCAGNAATGWRG
jgi:PleD family two-component response regulator